MKRYLEYIGKLIQQSGVESFEEFQRENRIRTNLRMNLILWACILAGPAVALGVRLGVFSSVRYSTCFNCSVCMLVLALVHLLMLRKKPTSILTGIIALFAIDCMLVYMYYAHIGIYLTWMLVPLMSLMFCDTRLFLAASLLNYLCMALSQWLVSPYYVALRSDYATVTSYFLSRMSGYTIEGLVMFAAGNSLCKVMTQHYRDLIAKFRDIRERDEQMREQMALLDSMAQIYDKVNLIDYEKMTEMPLRAETLQETAIEPGQTHSAMNQGFVKYIAPDQMEDFLHFTDLGTLRSRMTGRKIISGEFLHVVSGWFRAEYITVEDDAGGVPVKIIYTTQNIDAEKRREEHLLRISLTDELTRLYNRHSYEEDVAAYEGREPEQDLALFSIDVNGLKEANDTKGHAAGDELLCGTASCLSAVLGGLGKVYRTGGDEFLALLHTDDCAALRDRILEQAAEWHGMYNEKLSFSVGYASYADEPNADIHELEKIADGMMYEAKERYYQTEGVDRRRRRSGDARKKDDARS